MQKQHPNELGRSSDLKNFAVVPENWTTAVCHFDLKTFILALMLWMKKKRGGIS
jgi:rubredoxin